ncbi:FG-GAP-like repeat-containing protein [Myxococcota bacterium]|nr:FG-GAP-like repeat-containing protein [Myxococcota bacterium]
MRSLRVLALVLPSLALAACGDKDVTPLPTDDTDGDQLYPNLVVSSRTLDFGVLEDVGDSAQTQIVVENTGVGDLELTVTLSAPFSATQSNVVLTPQSSLQFTVYYVPTEYGEVSATMTLASNDPDEPEIAVTLNGAVATDADADGYLREEAGGDDCDDGNAEVNPGVVEEYYDNVDADCDGLSDWDQDQDGWIAKAKEPDADKGGGDCNDINAEIYPGGEDVWYDGVDGDCAGDNDYDQDGDSYGSKAYGKGSDCDDTDAEAYPDALERLNGKLDNCNGATDEDVATSSATTRYSAKASSTFFGYSATVGDIDGDGKDDLAVGARGGAGTSAGAVYLFMSKDGMPADGSTVDKASDSFVGLTSTEGLGTALHYFEDFEGDGVADLVVGGYYGTSFYGGLYLIDVDRLAGKTGGLGDAHTTVKGSSSGYFVGRSVARADLNADGLDDLLFDYSPSSSASSNKNYVGLLYGGNSGSITLTSVEARWTTEGTGTAAYETLSDGADLDGDGYEDWVFGDINGDSTATNDGEVYVLWGKASEYSASASALRSTAETVVSGEASSDYVGTIAGALPDTDGDGKGEIFFWHGADGDLGIVRGSAAMKGGGAILSSEADTLIDFSSSAKPTIARATADLDSDGLLDIFIGVESSGGRLYVFPGDVSGAVEDDQVLASVKGSTADSSVYFTHAMPSRQADLDNDGVLDVVLTDYGYDGDVDGNGSPDSNSGAVYMFLSSDR